MRQTRRRAGFTLFEMLVVMAIIVIMLGVALPTFEGWNGDSRVKGTADEIRGAWADARAHAIDEGVNYRFAVNFDSGRFKVAPDDTDHWENSDDAKDTEASGLSGPLSVRKTLPKGIKMHPSDDFSPNADGNGWSNLITFLPDGTCKENASLGINGDGVKPITIRMRGLTGTVTTE